MSGELALLLRIALRSLLARRLNLLIGGIILAGTLLLVVGGAVVGSVERGMSRSVPESLVGHLQLYSLRNDEEFDLLRERGWRLNPIPSFPAVRDALASVDNVRAVIPLSPARARILLGNPVDRMLEKLRAAVRHRQEHPDAASEAEVRRYQRVVEQQVRVLRERAEYVRGFARDGAADDARDAEALVRAASPEFWAGLGRDPLAVLEFLENRLAPLVADRAHDISLMGTDLEAFQKHFGRLRVVDGQPVPPGQRGFLLSKYYYENSLKLSAARKLEQLRQGFEGHPPLDFYMDWELSDLRDNPAHGRQILFQLDAAETEELVARLQRGLPSQEREALALLKQLFTLDASNWKQRIELFETQVAPMVDLYPFKVGDVLTLASDEQDSVLQTVQVRFYGTIEFEGMEQSYAVRNLLDLASFQALRGRTGAGTPVAEGASSTVPSRSRAEEELFGGAVPIVREGQPERLDEARIRELVAPARPSREPEQALGRADVDTATVTSAAIVLADGARLEESLVAVRGALARGSFPVGAVTWHTGSGFLGKALSAATAAVYIAAGLVLLVAVVILSVFVMIATLRRTGEIGAMRAMGAQRGFVLASVLAEVLVLGLASGLLGAGLGAWLVGRLGSVGIPGDGRLYLFFSGARLYPALTVGGVLVPLAVVLVLCAVCALYPAWLATRVPPVTAMRSEE
ncbi:FtsX-like permease family protein [Myxococcaceae bacterium GXIMD 01537]